MRPRTNSSSWYTPSFPHPLSTEIFTYKDLEWALDGSRHLLDPQTHKISIGGTGPYYHTSPSPVNLTIRGISHNLLTTDWNKLFTYRRTDVGVVGTRGSRCPCVGPCVLGMKSFGGTWEVEKSTRNYDVEDTPGSEDRWVGGRKRDGKSGHQITVPSESGEDPKTVPTETRSSCRVIFVPYTYRCPGLRWVNK